MTLEEYRLEYLTELRNEATLLKSDVRSLFLERTLAELTELELWADPVESEIDMTGRNRRTMRIDAYAYEPLEQMYILPLLTSIMIKISPI